MSAQTTAKTTPVSFNDLMLDAIHKGIKSQTRRIIKQEHFCVADLQPDALNSADPEQARHISMMLANSPYGQVGDRLTCGELTLEITNLHIQRVRDITARDAVREGLHTLPASGRYCLVPGMQYFGEASHDAREVFSWLWDDIYGEGSWGSNPWVWAIEFKRLDGAQEPKQ
ncbi:MAG: ASCH domain protein [Bacteriophage sp.]|nr:MAG: ASCH domain protein [Bacteriophage sp.]